MIIVSTSQIHKAYGSDVILKDITLTVGEHGRIALVGANGTGKSTLLKIIAGVLSYDGGELHIAKDATIGYLAQHSSVDSEKTVYEEVASVYDDIFTIEKNMRELELAMGQREVYEDATAFTAKSREYGRLSQIFTEKNGYAAHANVRGVLHGLDFPTEMYEQPVLSLSGGQKTRLALAKQLLIQPDLLLLDEPTNYLDIERLEWLEQYLKGYKGSLLVVSHDRTFLDALVEEVYEIVSGVAKRYKGNYTAYLKQKAIDLEQQSKRYAEQQAEIARTEEFIRRNIEGQNTKMAQGRRKKLEKMERIEKPLTHSRKVQVAFETDRLSGNDVLTVEHLAIGYGQPLLENIDLKIIRGERVALVGANGIGKSTLFKTILGEMMPLSGSVKFGTNLKIGFYTQEQEDLDMSKTILQEVWDAYPNLDRQEIRTILSQFLFTGDDLEKTIKLLSGGERARVALVKLMLQKANLLFLDEPTNHLDLLSKEVLEAALADYDGTMFFISHDRFFLNRLATKVIEFTPTGLVTYLGNYDDYVEKKQILLALKESEEAEGEVKQEKTDFHTKQAERKAERALLRERQKQEKRLMVIEEEIHKLEEKIPKLEEELSNPAIFDNPAKYKQVNDDYANSQEMLEKLFMEWEELSQELDE